MQKNAKNHTLFRFFYYFPFMLRGIFAILGVWIFIKLLPIVIAAIIAIFAYNYTQSEQQENKQWQGDKEYKTVKIGDQVWMVENCCSLHKKLKG
jgi:uncharacterized membrane protein